MSLGRSGDYRPSQLKRPPLQAEVSEDQCSSSRDAGKRIGYRLSERGLVSAKRQDISAKCPELARYTSRYMEFDSVRTQDAPFRKVAITSEATEP